MISRKIGEGTVWEAELTIKDASEGKSGYVSFKDHRFNRKGIMPWFVILMRDADDETNMMRCQDMWESLTKFAEMALAKLEFRPALPPKSDSPLRMSPK